MGDLGRRARRLEESAELKREAERRAAERTFAEALGRVSRAELLAMQEHFEQADRQEWAEEDLPLMKRLLALMDEVRNEESQDFPWRTEIREERRRHGDEPTDEA
jgi:hypothetical protein